MVNFRQLTAEICWRVWGTPINFNGFHVVAALLHGILVVGVSQTLRRWKEGATYIRQGGRHIGHWPTFLVVKSLAVSQMMKKNTNLSTKYCYRVFSIAKIWSNQNVGQCPSDGHPAECKWRPLSNAATLADARTRVPCSNAAKTWNPLKVAGVPQTHQWISAVSQPKFAILWGHVGQTLLFNKFFSDCQYMP